MSANLLKEIIEATVKSEFLENVNVWDAAATWELWEDIRDLYENIPSQILRDELDIWFKEHLKVYIASEYELRFELYPITHALIKLIKAVTLHLVSLPLIGDKGFKMVIDYEPQPFLSKYQKSSRARDPDAWHRMCQYSRARC